MKKNQQIWVGVAVIVLVIGAYWLGKSSTPQSATTNPNTSAPASTMSADEVFANKNKCQGYLEKARNDSVATALEIDAVDKVFYSQSLNTCLLEQFNLYPAHGSVAESEVLQINDALTGATIWSSQVYSPQLKYWDAEAKLDEQAQQYQ